MRVLNKEYWPHRVQVDTKNQSDDIMDIEGWLSEQVGRVAVDWNVVYHHSPGIDYYFRDRANAVMFVLKFGAA
jgi:hypothetical protein